METWFLVMLWLSVAAVVKSIANHFFFPAKLPYVVLPPGPRNIPIVGNFLWLRKSYMDLEPILRSLHAKFGPVVTLHIGSRPTIFVADRTLAHHALIQNGAIYADRPTASATTKIATSNQHNINSAPYGPTWRFLRRNLMSEILHPSRVKSYSRARLWVLEILKTRIESQAKSGEPVIVKDNFQYAMFCLLVLMCFGDELDESQIRRIEEAQRQMLVNSEKFNILNFWPSVTKILLRRHWEEFLRMHRAQEDVLIPLIRARKRVLEEESFSKNIEDGKTKDHLKGELCATFYIDSLLGLELPEEKRKLHEGEMVTLCAEFLNAGTDTTSTALEWIMANCVKYPHIQQQLFDEIKGVMADKEKQEVEEEDVEKMPYLKAVILEGLRRHPPAHFVLPHAVTQETVLDKYLVPKNGAINFMVAEMGWDPEVWEDPMAFKPERFVRNGVKGEAFDITGSREIKMMPFGAGRRICPGYGLAMLHLEYFVANLVWKYEWKCVEGVGVDLSEKKEFTVVMKYPLQAHVFPRIN